MAYRLNDLAWDLRKAISMSPGEAARRFFGRTVRYARRARQRRRVPALSDAELLAALVTPAASVTDLIRRRLGAEPLAPGALQSAVVARRLREVAPTTLEPILAAARAIASSTFDLLGSGPVPLGEDPDWHADFKSGKRWERTYSLEIVPGFNQGYDIKVPWELARLQHLPTLGLASALSGEARFKELGVRHLTSFMRENPVYRGVNWSCTMDVAIRAAQILLAEGYLREAGDERLWGEVLKSLVLHARFILDNLEDGPVRGNHYLSDLAGLFLCGLGLEEHREAASWKEFARTRLWSEMQRQVTGDGLDFEAALSYHAFVTEMFLFPALLAAEKGSPFPDPYLKRLETMVDAVATLIRPDGTLPQVGDNDDGRFLIVSQYYRKRRDWRPLLALGSYLFHRAEWLPLAGDAWVDGAWLLGERYLRWRDTCGAPSPCTASTPSLSAFPGFRCRAFKEGGIYQLGAGEVQMVVDAGGVGQGNNGGHAHNDTLAFDLYAFGREVLPDRGTGAYTPDLALRDRFRATLAHNTLQVDAAEINPFPDEPFRLIPADAPRVLGWRQKDRYACLRAEHTGYQRLASGVVHRRTILLDSRRQTFEIEEKILGRGRHRFVASFHLAPGWSATLTEDGWTARSRDGGPGHRLHWLRRPEGSRVQVEEDLHSPSYGVTCPASTVRIRWEGEAPARLRYILHVRGGGEG